MRQKLNRNRILFNGNKETETKNYVKLVLERLWTSLNILEIVSRQFLLL